MTNRLPDPPPPVEKRTARKTASRRHVEDEYAWLKAANWQEVLRDPAALPTPSARSSRAENALRRRGAGALHAGLRERWSGRCAGASRRTTPRFRSLDPPYLYYIRHSEGGQHPIFCRAVEDGGAEETLLDGDAEGAGKVFFDIAEARHSPDHAKLAWSADDNGSELHAIRVRDLTSTLTARTSFQIPMAASSGPPDLRQFYYVRVDENHRPAAILRH